MTEIICPLRCNYVLIIVFYIVVEEKSTSTRIKHVNYLHEISTKPLKVLCPIMQAKNEKVKFQRHLKVNTNLELPLKKVGLENVFKWENNDY